MTSVLQFRPRVRAIDDPGFYERLIRDLDRRDTDEQMPVPAERAAMRRQVAYAEVGMIVETAMSRLARAEALAVDVEHPATEALRQAREALAGAPVGCEREPCL
jgi:hypothetical protein